jgi:two-component system sensor histidine kinase ChvG
MGETLVPRFGIRTQISLFSLALVIIPLLGLSYWNDIRETVLSAQTRIQEGEAKVIATTLLATQQNIRQLLAADADSELQKHALSAPVIKKPIRLDGYFGDWPLPNRDGGVEEERFNINHPVWLAVPNNEDESLNETAFSLRLAQSSQHLYVALDIRDSMLVYRDPSHLRLDYNDHVQLSYYDAFGRLQRIIIPVEKEGSLASYFTDAQWQLGKDILSPHSRATISSHKTKIQGYWRKTNEGYAIEFRIPIAQLDTKPTQLHFAIVDVDDNPIYGPQAIVASLPKSLEDKLNPVALHASELQRVIDELKNTYARLWILDRRGREWAYAERDSPPHSPPYSQRYAQNESAASTQSKLVSFDSQCVKDALEGKIEPLRYLKGEDGELSRLIVCYPIIENQETLGVVVIDESANHVLAQEEGRMRTIAIKIGGTIALLFLVLFCYAFILVRRISRLSEEAAKSIDPEGRIEQTTIQASRNFPDEIGDLSRSISTLLQKQHSYVSFLERIPQTLRHEISNPLNKLRTSLENLLDEQPELSKNSYIRKIDTGIDQISSITLHLTEAASLESAIQEEQLVNLDLIDFLDGYLSTWAAPIESQAWDKAPALILGDSSRLEQLFDKLLDNAKSFCPENGKVVVAVQRSHKRISVIIENDGPLLTTQRSEDLFSPMVSTRSSGSSIHLGLGLHIAKLICDQHKAKLVGRNRNDGSGVIFSVEFDLSE